MIYLDLWPKEYTSPPNPHSDRRPFGTTYSADINDSLMLCKEKKKLWLQLSQRHIKGVMHLIILTYTNSNYNWIFRTLVWQIKTNIPLTKILIQKQSLRNLKNKGYSVSKDLNILDGPLHAMPPNKRQDVLTC